MSLRRIAMNGTTGELNATQRENILNRYEITEQDLLEFVETRKTETAVMAEIWTEVEAKLDSINARDREGPAGPAG